MSTELSLTAQDAQSMLDTIQLNPEDWVAYRHRTETERLALGVMCLNLHVSKGWTTRKIESETGIPRTTITRYREFALTHLALPTVDEARKLEVERLEALMEVWYPLALAGDANALASYMKLSSRLGEITGTNKPTQVEAVVHEITPQERELQALIQQQEAENTAALEELNVVDEAPEETQ